MIDAIMFSGSFNPIHMGHLAIARYIVDCTPVDELWLVVSPQNPFKSSNELADFHHRFTMVELALADLNLPVKVSNIETLLPQPSYTLNTLDALSEKYPDRRWSLLIGSDNLVNFDKWKKYDEIIEKYPLMVYPRAGFGSEKLYEKYGATKIDAPLLNISSTFIRNNINNINNMREFLPNSVIEYIRKWKVFG
ncbi:MAG: nicotinate-nucleotide adenylyltransferase [Prevotellaceae bacterium]|jgi:nicotinate-nucleotide adenylyltransferase|nr:nicotinate-nucleotide adenylyltransferase [Prevotellaceae bacterium]